MKKKKISEFDNETLDRVVAMAQEEKKPFEVLKEEFGVSENEVTDCPKIILNFGKRK